MRTSLRARGVAGVLILAAAGLALTLARSHRPTDYEKELGQIDADLARGFDGDATVEVHLWLRRSSMTGDPEDTAKALGIAKTVIRGQGASPALTYMKAALELRMHELDAASRTLEADPGLATAPDALLLRGDIALQRGRYEDARRDYRDSLSRLRSWAALAREAWLEELAGDSGRADALYRQAQEELSAKDMRAYAWLSYQRGYRELRHGRFAAALEHYRQAEKAYSGDWLADDYLAELEGAQGHYEEAVKRYTRLVSRTPRPDFKQALGDLYVYMGKPELARPWHELALKAYLASAERGERQYFHHLAGYYADVAGNGAEAVRWAKKDLELRPGYASHDALAWALYKSGTFAEAVRESDRALATGVKAADLFYHAGMIRLAAGETERGKELLRAAAAINPRFEAFHVHR